VPSARKIQRFLRTRSRRNREDYPCSK
jgi:hypothetical protein